MSIGSAQSGHWTDEQLIEHCYGVGPGDGHLENCAACAARLASMETRRQRLSFNSEPDNSFFADQRRGIYARLSQPSVWWRDLPIRRFASVAALVVILAGSGSMYRLHRIEAAEYRADAQLAQEVSQMSFDSEPQATAPLEGLFVE